MVYYLERQYDEAEKLFGETEGNPFWAILTHVFGLGLHWLGSFWTHIFGHM